jgi:hypothetical protein
MVTTTDAGQPISAPVYEQSAVIPPPIPGTELGDALAPAQSPTRTTTAQSAALTGQLPIALSPAKMNSPAVSYQASGAFESALSGNKTLIPSMATAAITPAMPSVDMDDFNKQAAVTFQVAMPAPARQAAVENSRQAPERSAPAPQSIKIENLYLQAEECQVLFDFVKMLMQAVHRPQAEAV